MKKLIVTLFALMVGYSQMPAQDVYNYLFENANKVVSNPKANFTSVSIARFKLAALTYMRGKKPGDVQFLNNQAYYMSEYLTLFMNEMVKGKDKKRSSFIVKTFMETSLQTPMFNDTNYATVRAYVSDKDLTPFSLDTDWEKAYIAVKNQIAKK